MWSLTCSEDKGSQYSGMLGKGLFSELLGTRGRRQYIGSRVRREGESRERSDRVEDRDCGVVHAWTFGLKMRIFRVAVGRLTTSNVSTVERK